MRPLTAAGGVLPTGTASTATTTTFDQAPLWFCPIGGINLRTSNQYAMDYISFWKMNILQKNDAKSYVRSRLGTYPYLGTWRTLLCGEVLFVLEWPVATWDVLFY